MKKLLSIFVVLLLAVSAFAQNPKLNYQAVIRDSENKLVVEQSVTVTVNVLKADNTSQFVQTLNATTNRNGLLSLEIGDETAAWSNIDWNGAKIRTAVAYDGNEMVDTAVVNAVPFALYANTVNTAAIPQSDWAETDNTKCTFILNKPSIADTVNNILTAGNYVTTATMDARGYLTSDSAVITTMLTNIASNTTNITANTNAIESLANRVNTFNTNVCDSVTTCINNAIDARGYLTSDSAVITTMQTSIASNTARVAANADKIDANASDITTNANAIESLANRVNTFNTNVCDSVTTCINNAMDARGYLTSDSAVITTMQTNIANNTANIATNAGNIATNASNITTNANAIAAAVGKEKADSTTLAGRITALESATMDCGDVKACIADTLSKYTTTAQLCTVVSNCDLSSNTSVVNLLQEYSDLIDAMTDKIDSLKHIVDSLTKITDGQPCPGTPYVFDVDNNVYNTVQIGEQCWMKENLRTTTLNGYGAYAEPSSVNVGTYGRLYDWTAMMQGSNSTNYPESGDKVRGICPNGWHVSSKKEWENLFTYVKSKPEYLCDNTSYQFLKTLSSTSGWNESTNSCTAGNNQTENNATGFSAYPAQSPGSRAKYWTATEYATNTSEAYNYSWTYQGTQISSDFTDKNSIKLSVRCLKD
ncbi:MAG: hypothetical protein MJZ87_10865 [Bacteroidales bacterium]|nr:hypothetical protein [Bacteroidales bacterium]